MRQLPRMDMQKHTHPINLLSVYFNWERLHMLRPSQKFLHTANKMRHEMHATGKDLEQVMEERHCNNNTKKALRLYCNSKGIPGQHVSMHQKRYATQEEGAQTYEDTLVGVTGAQVRKDIDNRETGKNIRGFLSVRCDTKQRIIFHYNHPNAELIGNNEIVEFTNRHNRTLKLTGRAIRLAKRATMEKWIGCGNERIRQIHERTLCDLRAFLTEKDIVPDNYKIRQALETRCTPLEKAVYHRFHPRASGLKPADVLEFKNLAGEDIRLAAGKIPKLHPEIFAAYMGADNLDHDSPVMKLLREVEIKLESGDTNAAPPPNPALNGIRKKTAAPGAQTAATPA